MESNYILSDVSSDQIEWVTYLIHNESILVSQERVSVIYEYPIIEGSNQTYSKKDLLVKIDGDSSLFRKIYMNDEELDHNYYDVDNYNCIVIKKEFLESLDSGTYKFRFVYEDGEASTNVYILKNPKTYRYLSIALEEKSKRPKYYNYNVNNN